ncbi:hypothetical protein Tco_0064414 [Tanacetum coccineum]
MKSHDVLYSYDIRRKILTTRQGVSTVDIEQLIAQRVADAMATFKTNRNNRNGTPQGTSGGTRGTIPTTRGCTYKEFLNCQPRNFKGTEGAVRLARWFEKMEYVFHISNFVIETTYEMSWKELMKMITKLYCPKNKIQKMENEMWNLTVKGTDVVGLCVLKHTSFVP